VRVEIALLLLAAPGRSPAATIRRTFSVSYDLWEERFAVAATGPRGAAVSHLTAGAAEAWCVEQLAVPRASFGDLGERFWLRLESRILDGDAAAGAEEEGLTLQRLIDVFSRRRRTESSPARAVEGGPFRLPK
jgi:hypothetical protein